MNKSEIFNLLDIRQGRMHRIDFLIFAVIAKFTGDIIETYIPDHWVFIILNIIINAFLLYFLACITAKRLRDINISGWFSLLMIFWNAIFLHLMRINLSLIESGFLSKNLTDFILYYVVASGLIALSLLFIIPPQKRNNRFGAYIKGNYFH